MASGFKITELVNFLVCFAELIEKDLIECYYLGIHINHYKISQCSFPCGPPSKNLKSWSRAYSINIYMINVKQMNKGSLIDYRGASLLEEGIHV